MQSYLKSISSFREKINGITNNIAKQDYFADKEIIFAKFLKIIIDIKEITFLGDAIESQRHVSFTFEEK